MSDQLTISQLPDERQTLPGGEHYTEVETTTVSKKAKWKYLLPMHVVQLWTTGGDVTLIDGVNESVDFTTAIDSIGGLVTIGSRQVTIDVAGRVKCFYHFNVTPDDVGVDEAQITAWLEHEIATGGGFNIFGPLGVVATARSKTGNFQFEGAGLVIASKLCAAGDKIRARIRIDGISGSYWQNGHLLELHHWPGFDGLPTP